MSSASLAVPARPQSGSRSRPVHPDAARIAAISAAIALNLAVMVIATRPISPAQLDAVRSLVPTQLVRLIEAPPKIPSPPPIQLKPLQHPVVVPRVHVQPRPMAMPVVAPVTEPSTAVPLPSVPPSSVDVAPGLAAPVEARLAYRSAPLSFPVQALRQHMQGTVLLRVLVDETGKPLDVQVERGSGYALLDRSAREQVLSGWRFQPAMVDGRAVRAWANVPVSFALRQM
jgi:periplasmic protein TonB